ncbi:MAG: GxxExxY protein [Gammaproteobacteria bacterium]|nr:GxxExxY protein [Gammaproteobacteria bacterium]
MDEDVSRRVIGAAIEVHRHLGPGLLESSYSAALARELSLRGLTAEREVPVLVSYKGDAIEDAYRLDFLVERSLVVELKTVEVVLPVHRSQLLTYLRWTGLRLGLLINFNVPLLRDGISRVVNKKFL